MICDFSVEEVRKKLMLDSDSIMMKIRKLFNKTYKVVDHGLWNHYAINELESYHEIDLTVISFHAFMKKKLQRFDIGSTKYIFIRMRGMTITSKLGYLFNGKEIQREKDLALISGLIKEINPDIIHVIGAETSYYSEAILKVPRKIPTIVQLQTLLADPDAKIYYPGLEKRIPSERRVLERADYIATPVKRYGSIIKKEIKNNAVILNTFLALTEPIDRKECKKEFDFVYFAADISKACDLAINAFVIAKKKHPEITLDIVGFYNIDYKKELDIYLQNLGISDSVFFEGRLDSHEDVINQIRKARFALIPTKMDMISSTQREAMANGLPLVATITNGTPILNLKRESALLSVIGDDEAMANNMLRLLDNSLLADQLRENAYITSSENKSNKQAIKDWVICYKCCIEHHSKGVPIPHEYLLDC